MGRIACWGPEEGLAYDVLVCKDLPWEMMLLGARIHECQDFLFAILEDHVSPSMAVPEWGSLSPL